MLSLVVWGPVPRKERRSSGTEAKTFWRFSAGSRKRAEREMFSRAEKEHYLFCGSAAGEQMDSLVVFPPVGFCFFGGGGSHNLFILIPQLIHQTTETARTWL